MFWHLIAAVFAALGGAGVALLLRTLTRKLLPKWIVPAFAGLGMLAYTIHYEYTWFDYKEARLPEGSVVVASEKGAMFWRPWTVKFPMTLVYTVLDGANAQIDETEQGRVARFVLYRFEKQHLLSSVTGGAYQMLCTEQVMFRLNEEGFALFETLREVDAEDPLYLALCKPVGG